MSAPLAEVCCACFPAGELAALAEVRCVSGVRVALAGGRAWLRWQPGDDRVLRRVLPIRGVQLYFLHANRWHRFGHHLPAFDFPIQLEYRPLDEVLIPAPVEPIAAPAWDCAPFVLALARDDRPRPTAALACALVDLASWADGMPAVRLAELHAAQLEGRVLLLGKRLPLLPVSERFWGQRVLVPLGFRLDPSLPETFVLRALGLNDDELLLIRAEKCEVLSRSVFEPLTRAGLLLAYSEVRR
jgi:hypothetical protein